MSEDRLTDLIYTLQKLRIAPLRLIYSDRFNEEERGQFLKAWYIYSWPKIKVYKSKI